MRITDIFKNEFDNLSSSLKRFPYALVFSTLSAILLIFLVNITSNYELKTIEIFERLAMTMALGFPLFLSIKTTFERKTEIKVIHKIIMKIIAITLLFGYYFFLSEDLNMVTISRFIAINLSLYLLFLIIPYFYKKQNFELYVLKIFTRLAITFIYSIILTAGLFITLFTIDKLLNIPIAEELYISTGLVVIGIFAPIFLLAEIPKPNEELNLNNYPAIFKILLLYIVMPLISVYTSILYIYFIKIIIIQQLPEGVVTHLVLWYTLSSIAILFFISPLKSKNNWVKSFSFLLPMAIIPLLLMMFLAMKIRINNYGFTENRYFVVLMGIWSIGIMLYYVFSKKKRNIILPLTLAILALLAVFGPWSSYSVSIYSQNNRFGEIIKKYDMVEGNTIIKNGKKITESDQQKLKSILRYFEYNHRFDDLKYLPDNFKTSDTEKLFGFSYQKRLDSSQREYFSYTLNQNNRAISIKDYDYFYQISNYHNEVAGLNNNLTVKLSDLNQEIIIIQNETEIYSKSLIPILVEFHQKNKDMPIEKLNKEEFTYTEETSNLKLKFIFNSFYGSLEKKNPDNINIRNIDLYLLIYDSWSR